MPGDSILDPLMYFSLKATMAGVPVVAAAGNSGSLTEFNDRYFTVANSAPWVFTVAASTIDRGFSRTLFLENGVSIKVLFHLRFVQSCGPSCFLSNFSATRLDKVIAFRSILVFCLSPLGHFFSTRTRLPNSFWISPPCGW